MHDYDLGAVSRLDTTRPLQTLVGRNLAPSAEERGHDQPVVRMTVDSQLTITIDPACHAVTITLAGELDIAVSAALLGLLINAVKNAEKQTVVVDVTKITFIDSSGINCLLTSREVALEQGTLFYLQGAENGPVSDLATITGVGDHLESGFERV